MTYVKEFWTGKMLFTKYDKMEVFYKSEKGDFVAVPNRPEKGFFSTYEWLRVESEEGCRNLCCSFPDFECTAYSWYAEAPQDNGDDCKLILNANDNKVIPSQKTGQLMHGRIKAHLNDQCGVFLRERQLFEAIQDIRLQAWFKDIETEKECAEIMCEKMAKGYSFYPMEQTTQWGNCKIYYADPTTGVHRVSAKKGLKHGLLASDKDGCRTKPITKHKGGNPASGFYGVYQWKTVNNEMECQTMCCDNLPKFEGGCGAYSYFRSSDRKLNCKLLAKGFESGPKFRSMAGPSWVIHGALVSGDKPDEPKSGDECGYPLKKAKIKGSQTTAPNASDACGCEDACKDKAAWVFDVKKKRCTCHERKNEKRAVNVANVKTVKKVAKAKVIASVNETGEL